MGKIDLAVAVATATATARPQDPNTAKLMGLPHHLSVGAKIDAKADSSDRARRQQQQVESCAPAESCPGRHGLNACQPQHEALCFARLA